MNAKAGEPFEDDSAGNEVGTRLAAPRIDHAALQTKCAVRMIYKINSNRGCEGPAGLSVFAGL